MDPINVLFWIQDPLCHGHMDVEPKMTMMMITIMRNSEAEFFFAFLSGRFVSAYLIVYDYDCDAGKREIDWIYDISVGRGDETNKRLLRDQGEGHWWFWVIIVQSLQTKTSRNNNFLLTQITNCCRMVIQLVRQDVIRMSYRWSVPRELYWKPKGFGSWQCCHRLGVVLDTQQQRGIEERWHNRDLGRA